MLRGDALSRQNILRCETIWSRVTFEAAIVLRANDITRLTRLSLAGFVLDTGTSWLYADSTEDLNRFKGYKSAGKVMRATLMSHRTELALRCAASGGHRMCLSFASTPGSSFSQAATVSSAADPIQTIKDRKSVA